MKKKNLKNLAIIIANVLNAIAGSFHPIVFLCEDVKKRAAKDYYRKLLTISKQFS